MQHLTNGWKFANRKWSENRARLFDMQEANFSAFRSNSRQIFAFGYSVHILAVSARYGARSFGIACKLRNTRVEFCSRLRILHYFCCESFSLCKHNSVTSEENLTFVGVLCLNKRARSLPPSNPLLPLHSPIEPRKRQTV